MESREELREKIAIELFYIWKEAKSTTEASWDDVTWDELPEKHKHEYYLTVDRIISLIEHKPSEGELISDEFICLEVCTGCETGEHYLGNIPLCPKHKQLKKAAQAQYQHMIDKEWVKLAENQEIPQVTKEAREDRLYVAGFTVAICEMLKGDSTGVWRKVRRE